MKPSTDVSTKQQTGCSTVLVDEEQALILNRVGEAIALFNSDQRLVLFNQKFVEMLALQQSWLLDQPTLQEILDRLAEHGTWSSEYRNQILQQCCSSATADQSIFIQQSDHRYLELSITETSNEGKLIIFRDLTIQKRAQKQLSAEVHRLRFLLGLTERLQTSENLTEICGFALNYLVEAMGAAFGDVKVVSGYGKRRTAGTLVNQVSGDFIATYGEPAVKDMEKVLEEGIPHGQGLLWQVVDTGQPLFVEDYTSHPQAVKAFCHADIGQLGIFPIPSADGTIIGVVTLESRSLQKLQEAPQQDMLLAACQTLGAAIERAQSQERLQHINQDLEQASRLKSEFLTSMSHELRTPLNSILGFSELLLRHHGNPSDRQIAHIQAIRRSGQHLLNLINDILDLSKVEAGKFELDLNSVSVHNICRDCLQMMRPRAERKRLALSLGVDYRIDHMNLDERRVRQMIINLLSNAIKFTPEQGEVRLSVALAYGRQLLEDYRPDDSPINVSTPYLQITVADTGIGISEEKKRLLFRPFQQIDASLTRHHDGTGLGLALTKRLAEMHGGTVSMQTQEHEGSTFRIWLPFQELRQPAETASSNPVTSSVEYSGSLPGTTIANVLVVEDQPYNQALISEVLELEGLSVNLISDGQVLLDILHAPAVAPNALPDLVLMDIQLPNVDGLQLIRALKANEYWRTVPVVAVTAMAMAGDRDRCLEAGADDYVAKPIDIMHLTQKVRKFSGLES